jgi:nucleoside-diphosphate-sugar epimerase
MARFAAIVAGATGVVGRGLAEALAADAAWDLIALARKPLDIPGARFVSVDLASENDARSKLGAIEGTTHIFYAGRFDHAAGKPEPIQNNLAMLRHLVETIEPRAPQLQHIHLVEGTKWYGSHLGAFRTPAHEDDPRSVSQTFYYAQQDYLSTRQSGASWSWSASRPHCICHAVPDEPRNIVSVIAAYALIFREMGLPLCFPGTPANYRALYQCTSADQLVAAIRWMAVEPSCANQAFNILNGDYIRWENLWPTFANYFGMEVGPVRTIRLADVMVDKAPVWNAIVARHGLRPTPYERLANWSYGDFVFTPAWDIMSDMTKARMGGFDRAVRTEDEFIRYFELFRASQVLP